MAVSGPFAGVGAPGDVTTCRYGGSPLPFRGPERALDSDACLMLGGTEIWGEEGARPAPLRLEEETGRPVVNLGLRGGGLDTILGDPVILGAVGRARLSVVQAMGAQNLSNAYYAVHPRRNDRLVAPRAALRTLYEDLDLTGICFTRHLTATLIARSPQRFALVAAELRAVWTRQMRALADRAEGRLILLWIGAPPPSDATVRRLGPEPVLVTEAMIAELRPRLRAVVEVPSPLCPASDRDGEIVRALADLVR